MTSESDSMKGRLKDRDKHQREVGDDRGQSDGTLDPAVEPQDGKSIWDKEVKIEVLREKDKDTPEKQAAGGADDHRGAGEGTGKPAGEAAASNEGEDPPILIIDEEESPPSGAEPAEPKTPASADDALAAERDRLKEDLLRREADFINFRRRMEREKEEFARHANQRLIEALLPVLDNFELALKNHDTADIKTYREGVTLIYKQLNDILASHGLKPIHCMGEKFDPNIHEAVAVTCDPRLENQTIVEELKRGYQLQDRLIRSPMVRVVVHEEDSAAGDAPAEGPAETDGSEKSGATPPDGPDGSASGGNTEN